MNFLVRLAFLLLPVFAFVADGPHRSSRHHNYAREFFFVMGGGDGNDAGERLVTLPQYLQDNGVDHVLHQIICQAAKSCLKISQELSKFPITSLHSYEDGKTKDTLGGNINIQGEEQKPMDVVANEIFITSLKDHVSAIASEEEKQIIKGNDKNPTAIGPSYEIAFDPLDGSSNLDVHIATGSIFGISPYNASNPFSSSGRSLVSAGYSVYSSSLEFVISLSPSAMSGSQVGNGRYSSEQSIASGFTLDPRLLSSDNDDHGAECFILTRPNMKCPQRESFTP